jgi:arginyl-tRNA synthetase
MQHLSPIPSTIDPWAAEFSLLISQASQGAITADEVAEQLTKAPNADAGHLAFPCFQLSKKMGKNPAQVAQGLKQQIESTVSNGNYVASVTAQGPYLNVYWKWNKLVNEWFVQLGEKNYFHHLYSRTRPPKCMLEYSQPNTHKEMHVGHMRNVCLGNALIKLLRYCGMEVISATYPGDVGTHVAKCLWYVHRFNAKAPKENLGAWLGSMYSKAHNLLEDEKNTPQEEKNRQELTEILNQIHQKSGPYYDEWLQTRVWSINLMKEVYDWLDVQFDLWYFESDVDESSLKLVDDYLAKGLFKVDDGAVGVDLKDENLGFVLLKKRDGHGLYATKDLELARKKFIDLKIEKNLYLVDVRQSLHFKQVFKVLELMGFSQAKDCVHLGYEMVELPSGAMSSRKGNIVPIGQLIDEMQQTIVQDYLAQYKSEWSAEQIQLTAKQVANGAIKYGMVRVDPQKKIIFDLKEWLRLDGNSGPYIQYTATRLSSILQRNQFDSAIPHDFSGADLNSAEVELLIKLLNFHQVVWTAGQKLSVHLVANYLFELSQAVNTFYVQSPILNEPLAQKRQDRLMLVWMAQKVLAKGLALLGIECPEKM